MKKIYTFIIASLVLAACGDDKPKQDTVDNKGTCDFTQPKCSGDKTQVCRNGKLIEESCPSNTSCKDGDCVSDNTTTCSDNFEDSCKNGKREYCEGGTVQYETCQHGSCTNGKCPQCEENDTICLDGTTRQYCENGELKTETCPFACVEDSCKVLEKCGNGEPDPGEICDDGPDNGQYGKCRKNCQGVSECGDGILDSPDEECEPDGKGWVKNCDDSCHKIEAAFSDYPTADDYKNYMNGALPECHQEDIFLKYLHYRERFLGNAAKHIPGFVTFGTNPGDALPAASRDPLINCSNYWRMVDCEFTDYPDAQGAYNYGDTTIWLGIMIHWLATEWKLYHELGISTKETEQLLYYALKAFDRLDLKAEELAGMEGKLDGFFIRDDVPLNYYLNGSGYRFERTDAPNTGYECVASGITCMVHQGVSAAEHIKSGSYVSQDQLTGLFDGYGMLIALLPDDVVVENMNLREHAQETIHRMMTFMKDNNWQLRMIVDGKYVLVPEEWGGVISFLGQLFANATNHMVGDKFGVEDYTDGATTESLNLLGKSIDLLWPAWETNNNYNRNLVIRLMSWADIWDAPTFIARSILSGRDIFPMIRSLVHQQPIEEAFPLWEIHQNLAAAPCGGPCDGKVCPNQVPGWMGETRYITPNSMIGYQAHSDAEFNGLDYLMAHNLYALSYLRKFGHSYTQKLPQPTGASEGALGKYIQDGTEIASYQASDNASDLNMLLCGKPFGDWLRDNSEGLVDIYTGKNRWQCQSDLTCTVTADNSPYTHKNALILGSSQNDTITVNSDLYHCIVSFDGDDVINVTNGFVVIEANGGNNNIEVRNAKSFIYTGNGNDTIRGTGAVQFVVSGDGDDTITTGDYNDLIFSGGGNDTIYAGDGNNTVRAGDGNDAIFAGDGSNLIRGEAGNDRISIGNGQNYVYGDEGHNFVRVGNGKNTITAVSPLDGQLYICLGTGKNTIWGGWSTNCRANEAPASDFHDNSCAGQKLTADDCTNAFKDWFTLFP